MDMLPTSAFRRCLTLLLLLALAPVMERPASAGEPIGTTIKYCVSTDSDISCENKLWLSLDIAFGLTANLDVAYMDTSSTGKITLEQPITINLVKTRPVWSYPLRYLQTVDFAPYEELVRVNNSRPGIAACSDGSAAAAPTCGWQLDGGGNRIADSQGFCSNRSLLQLKSSSDPAAWWRGEKELAAQSTLTDSFSIGHCLRQSGVSYRGYEIDPPRRDYRINFTVTKAAATLFTFSLSPDIPVWLDISAHPVHATLTADGDAGQAPPDLSGSIVYLPTALVNGKPDWNSALLLPRQLVSVDGSDCDKVGTGYSAFRSQLAGADKSVAGACLGNQLKQLLAADLALLTANPEAETDYLLRGKKLFKSGLAEMTGLALKVVETEPVSSRVALELDAAQSGTTTYEAVGWIKDASATPFNSLTRQGVMNVVIENVGSTTADYIVALTGCQPGIEAVSPQARTIAPLEQVTFAVPLRSSVDLTGSHFCWVVLTAPTGREYDRVQIFFDTTGVVEKKPQELMLKNPDTRKTP